jgi:hypothetical protein
MNVQRLQTTAARCRGSNDRRGRTICLPWLVRPSGFATFLRFDASTDKLTRNALTAVGSLIGCDNTDCMSYGTLKSVKVIAFLRASKFFHGRSLGNGS